MKGQVTIVVNEETAPTPLLVLIIHPVDPPGSFAYLAEFDAVWSNDGKSSMSFGYQWPSAQYPEWPPQAVGKHWALNGLARSDQGPHDGFVLYPPIKWVQVKALPKYADVDLFDVRVIYQVAGQTVDEQFSPDVSKFTYGTRPAGISLLPVLGVVGGVVVLGALLRAKP